MAATTRKASSLSSVVVCLYLLAFQPGTEPVPGFTNAPRNANHQHQPMQQEQALITVEVDIFSGMPNPEWTLSEASATMLMAKLSGMPKTTVGPRSTNLGYRGLVVRIAGEGERTLFIHKGLIESRQGDSSTFLLDKDRAVEGWLIRSGRESLSDEVRRLLDAELPD